MRLQYVKQKWYFGLAMIFLCGFIGCTAVDDGGTGDPTGTPGASLVVVSADTYVIQSSGEDPARVSATVLDENGGLLQGVNVVFRTDNNGQLSESTATTGDDGKATVLLTSGAQDQSNRNITVTAEVIGVENDFAVVQVTGTEVAADLTDLSLTPGSDETTELTVIVTDAQENPVRFTDVSVAIDSASSNGSVTFETSSSGQTDSSGVFKVTLGAGGSGTVVLNVTAAGVTISTDTITVEGDAFGITAPAANDRTMPIGGSKTITVNAPEQTSVRISTSIGTLANVSATPASGTSIVVPVSGGTASATLTSDIAGIATVQAAENNASLTPSESVQIGVSAPATSATVITLQGNASVVPLSIGNVENSVTLTATVKNATGEPVGGSLVQFSFSNGPGGQEYINPTMGITDAQGQVESTFTSGSISSDNPIIISADVLNSSLTVNTATFELAIGGTAGSIMIGQGTSILSTDEDTAYSQPMVVVVADANGNPVEGAQISLSAWPTEYYDGYWTESGDEWVIVYLAGGLNEDINQNVLRDDEGGDDEDAFDIGDVACSYRKAIDGTLPFIATGEGVTIGGNDDGELTPANSAGGTLDSAVTTDAAGKAQFNLTYAKSSATWVVTRVTATTTVLGSETVATYTMQLPHAESDEGHLPGSPYELYSKIVAAGGLSCP